MLVESNRSRVPELVPLRYERMAASPFAFLRGSALVMAHDLATCPAAGPTIQLCGDAHISNFGIFASPERHLVFDLNDFDETFPGPFEWDVKRLAASIAVAGRSRGLSRSEAERLVALCVGDYQRWLDQYAELSPLDLWYTRLEVEDLVAQLEPGMQRRSMANIRRVATKNHLKARDKLTEVVDGQRRIRVDPPLIERVDAPDVRERVVAVLEAYVGSLSAERRALVEQYRFVDFARKVVGVGSVGTRCFIVLLEGSNGSPLFLQVKEAQAPSPQLALGARAAAHQGRRVVEGQRRLQAVSDVLLGWATDPETSIDYFVRQLWDAKGSTDVALLRPAGFTAYTRFCARALARAHAGVGDAAIISGYLGRSDTFPEAIARFADAYADQTERDHGALVAALADGRLPLATPSATAT